MSRLFISYRTSDGKKDASRLTEELCQVFGSEQVFFDKHDLVGGSSWRDEIVGAIRHRPIVLVLLTPDYFGATHADGRLRLHDADDPVRQELGASLEIKATIIPLLGEGITMPAAEDLPIDLRALTEKHALRLRTDDWKNDLLRIIDDLVRLGLQPLQADWRLRFGGSARASSDTKPWYILLGLAFFLLLLFELGVAQVPEEDTYYGAAFLSLFPLGMAWLAFTRLKHSGKLGKYLSIAVLVITAWDLLSFIGRGVNVAKLDANKTQQDERPVLPETPSEPSSPSRPRVRPLKPEQEPKEERSAPDLTGAWTLLMNNGQSLPFTVKQRGDHISFSTSKLDVTNDPSFQMLNNRLAATQGFVVHEIRIRGEGSVDDGDIEVPMSITTGDGTRMLDQGNMTLVVSPDGKRLDGSVQFTNGVPTTVHFIRQ